MSEPSAQAIDDKTIRWVRKLLAGFVTLAGVVSAMYILTKGHALLPRAKPADSKGEKVEVRY